MNFGEFSDWIRSHVHSYEAGDHDALARALAPFAQTGASCGLLSSMLADTRWLDDILRTSYRHPNGFDKIVLLSAPGYQARLHIWRTPDGLHQDVENIHNHRWDFSTLLLLGGYRYREFTLAEGGEAFHAYCYDSVRGTPSYSLEPLGHRLLSCCYDAHLGAGSSYTMTTGAFHRVIGDPGRLTATLLVQGRHRATSVLVFAEQPRPIGAALPLSRFSRASLTYDLETLLGRLKATG